VVVQFELLYSLRKREIGIFVPNNQRQRQRRTLHAQKDALPFAVC